MEIFAIFVLPAGGVVVCSITVNSVPEQKPEGISSYWALLSTAEVSSVSWLGVWFLHTAFKYFSALDPGWTDEMMCSGSLPLSQDQPHTHAHTLATRLFFVATSVGWRIFLAGWSEKLFSFLFIADDQRNWNRLWHQRSFHGPLFFLSVVVILNLISECFLIYLRYISDTGHL